MTMIMEDFCDMAIDALKGGDAEMTVIPKGTGLMKPCPDNGADLISRADAMGAVQDHFNADGFKGYDDGQQMMDRIKALPSAEAVQVVRCKECKYWSGSANTLHNNHLCKRALDQNVDYWTRSDDYCSYGERREDGEA